MKSTKCKIKGCNKPIRACGYCYKHYTQLRNKNKIETKYDKNIINIFNNYAEVTLKNIYFKIVGKTLIDIENIDIIKKYKWCKNNEGYAQTTLKNNKVLRMHKLLCITKEGYIVDHINRNKLDNRKINLRQVNKSMNGFNCKLSKNNTSGYNGVSFDKSKNKWIVQIKKNYKNCVLGRFNNFLDAIKCRKEAEKYLIM